MAPQVLEPMQSFAIKGEEKPIGEAFYASRGKRIEEQWRNFTEQPITGHGFGIYSSGDVPSGVKTFLGIPISAPTEKGFIPTAVLEETGIIGSIFFLYFLFSLIRLALKGTDIRWIAMFFGCLFVNVGEAVFFSVGGIGLHIWLLMGLAIGAAEVSPRGS